MLLHFLAYDVIVANISILNAEDTCMNQRKWWIFMISIGVTFYTGLFAVLLCRFVVFLCYRKNLNEISSNDPKQKRLVGEKNNNRYQAIIAKTTVGKILVCEFYQWFWVLLFTRLLCFRINFRSISGGSCDYFKYCIVHHIFDWYIESQICGVVYTV